MKWMRAFLQIAFFGIASILISLVAFCATPESDCKIYDGTMYAHKPNLNAAGFEPVNVIYEGALWLPGVSAAGLPSRSAVVTAARSSVAAGRWLVLDIERWKVDATVDDVQFDINIQKLLTVITWAREAAPAARIGYYGLAPMPAVAWALEPEGGKGRVAWRSANERLGRLAAATDAIFPSLYTYRNDADEWVAAAIANIDEAKRYEKPVFPFIWPQFVERNKELGYQYVPDDFWRRQLETVCRHAGGAVIWGGWNPKMRRPAEWQAEAGWWQVTQDFLRPLPQPPGAVSVQKSVSMGRKGADRLGGETAPPTAASINLR